VYAGQAEYVLRFHDLCEFHISKDGRTVVCLPGPRCEEGLVQVLTAGTVAAWLLTLRGLAVVHGSAVCLGNAAVILAGRSGLGKSTVAALCCAAGAQLVADDVVPLRNDAEGVVCTGLGHELRLRPQASEIAGLFSPPLASTRLTADGRLALRPPRAVDEQNLVSAVVLPRPVRDGTEVLTRRLEPGRAMLHLLANARIGGLAQASLQKAYFETVSALATSVPVLEATVPWGPPFRTDVAYKLLAQASAAASAPQ
jgi:hypothetical protein